VLALASCREKNGQLATAWGLFLDAERQTRTAADEPTQKMHDFTLDRVKKLEPRVSKLTISVAADSQLDGLEIALGAETVVPVMWNRALPVDGGAYTVTARAPGTAPWSTQVLVSGEGDTKAIDIPRLATLTPRTSETKPATSATTQAPAVMSVVPATTAPEISGDSAEAAPQARRSLVLPLSLGAGSLALAGTAVAFELSAEATYNTAKGEPSSQPLRNSDYDSANSQRHLAQGFAIGSALGAGTALWLYLTGRHVDDKDNRTVVIATPAGLSAMGRF
jgi:hypothetical protein